MITKTTISHNRANYLEQFGELSKTISAETITEAFDSDSLRKVFSENALSSLEKDNVLKDLKIKTSSFYNFMIGIILLIVKGVFYQFLFV